MEKLTAYTATLCLACIGTTAVAGTVVIRQGLDGYEGTKDTWFSERTTSNEYLGFPGTNYIRTGQWAAANQQALLQFVGAEDYLIAGGTITSATLQVTVPSDITYASGEANSLYQMLVEWDDIDAYAADPWVGGATLQVDFDDTEAASTPIADSLSYADANNEIAAGTVISFDVTSVVQGWANGGANYGFLFQSLGLKAGDGLFMASSEYAGADGEIARPTLIIEGDVVSGAGLVGDTDGDGDIDDFDLINAIVAYTGSLDPGTGGKGVSDGDTDDDQDVDDFDLINMIVGYTGSLSAPSVPEPASVMLLGMGGLLLSRRRSR